LNFSLVVTIKGEIMKVVLLAGGYGTRRENSALLKSVKMIAFFRFLKNPRGMVPDRFSSCGTAYSLTGTVWCAIVNTLRTGSCGIPSGLECIRGTGEGRNRKAWMLKMK
jgi:hypothetical protein